MLYSLRVLRTLLRTGSLVSLVLALAWACPAIGYAQDVPAPHPLQMQGHMPTRGVFSQFPWESIDTFSGNVTLTFTDLVLPGNAGFDLRIVRTHSYPEESEIICLDAPPSIMHFDPLTANPVISLSNGGQARTFWNQQKGLYMTTSYWEYNPINSTVGTVKTPEGLLYTYTHLAGDPATMKRLTEVADAFGNYMTLTYTSDWGTPLVDHIYQDLGNGESRTVYFERGTGGGVQWITWGDEARKKVHYWADGEGYHVTSPAGATWTYSQQGGDGWRVTTPYGGWVQYNWTFLPGPDDQTGFPSFQYRALAARTTGGHNIAGGTWTFDYHGAYGYFTTVSGPTSIIDYHHTGATLLPTPLLDEVVTKRLDGTPIQVVNYDWAGGTAVGAYDSFFEWHYPEDYEQWPDPVPYLPTAVATSRDGLTFTKKYHYDWGNNFEDFGQPSRIVETGTRAGKRCTDLTYQHNFSAYIRGRVASQTISAGSDTDPDTGCTGQGFVTTFDYNLRNGFLNTTTRYGIPTGFGEGVRGQISDHTDGRDFVTSYGYSWGTVSEIGRPAPYTDRRRTIRDDGTIESEKQWLDMPGLTEGPTTGYSHDGLGRETSRTPPIGNTITTEYSTDQDGPFTKVTRGGSWTRTDLDGFGRSIGTRSAIGVYTDINYDADGRMTYEGLPYTTTNVGTRYQYDELGRVKLISHSDGSSVGYTYTKQSGVPENGALKISITDENGRTTQQFWRAWGDPDSAVLVGIVDAEGGVTSYEYDAIGNLTSASVPDGGTRTWSFGGTDRVYSETHPESGTVTYEYDGAGNLHSRADARGTVLYEYDGNGRLTKVDVQGSSADDITIGFEPRLSGGSVYAIETDMGARDVFSEHMRDAAGRLMQRTDTVNGREFISNYAYDGNDNVTDVWYPYIDPTLMRHLKYDYNSGNRVTKVYDWVNGAPGTVWAGNVTYHPSGALAGYTAGNGITHSYGYDENRYWPTTVSIGGGVLGLTYHYSDDGLTDRVGNPLKVTDARSGMSQVLRYDDLDRLETADGPWGALQYSYDGSGNRIWKSQNNLETTYTFDPTTRRLTSISGGESESLAYHPSGDVWTDALGSYSYTPHGMVGQMLTTAGLLVDFRYDGDQMRILRQESGKSHYTLRGPVGTLSEYKAEGTAFGWVRDYIYLNDRIVASVVAGAEVPPPAIIVQLDSTSSSVPENVGQMFVRVRVTTGDGQPTGADVTFNWATQDGSAVAPYDYIATSGSHTFPAGTANGAYFDIPVNIVFDTDLDAGQNFGVRVTNASGGVVGVHTVTIELAKAVRFDMNGDSKPDIVWHNPTTGYVVVWFMNGAAQSGYDYVRQGQSYPTMPYSLGTGYWSLAGIADFNLDGHNDLLWRDAFGAHTLWYMQGTELVGTGQAVPQLDMSYKLTTVTDMNLDDNADLVWRSGVTGANCAWYLQNGIPWPWMVEGILTVSDVNWEIVGSGAVDADAHNDLLWRNRQTGENVVWFMNGAQKVSHASLLTVTDLSWRIIDMTDINRDGKPDILWRNTVTGQNVVWYMDGTTRTGYASLPTQADMGWRMAPDRW